MCISYKGGNWMHSRLKTFNFLTGFAILEAFPSRLTVLTHEGSCSSDKNMCCSHKEAFSRVVYRGQVASTKQQHMNTHDKCSRDVYHGQVSATLTPVSFWKQPECFGQYIKYSERRQTKGLKVQWVCMDVPLGIFVSCPLQSNNVKQLNNQNSHT